MAEKSRFAVNKFMTTLWFALTFWRPGPNGCGFRPKSSRISSGVAVTRQKLAYVGQGRCVVNDDLRCLCDLGIRMRLEFFGQLVRSVAFAHVVFPFL